MSDLVAITVYLQAKLGQFSTHTRRLYRSFYEHLQFDNMRVSQQLQVLNLSLHAPNHIPREKLSTRDDLEGDLAATGLVDGEFHLSERALTQDLERLVLVEALHIARGGRGLGRSFASTGRARVRRHSHGGGVGTGRFARAFTRTVAVGRTQRDGKVFLVESGGHDERTT